MPEMQQHEMMQGFDGAERRSDQEMSSAPSRKEINERRCEWLAAYMRGELPMFGQMHIAKDASKVLTGRQERMLGKLIQAGIAGKVLLAAAGCEAHLQDAAKRSSGEILAILEEMGIAPDALDEAQTAVVKRIASDGEDARKFFAEKNLGLVNLQVGRQRRNKNLGYLEYDELVEEGCIGLLKAIDHFDPSRGCKFSTPACFWIDQPIKEYLDQKTKAIRTPTHMNTLYKNILYAQKALRNTGLEDENITDEMVSAWLIEHGKNITVEKIQQARALRKETVSYDVPLGNDDANSKTMADTIESDEDLENSVVNSIGASRGFDTILSLVYDDRKRSILRDWYSSEDTKEAVILSNVSRKHCLTKERVKQLKSEAEAELKCRLADLGWTKTNPLW